jgi:two-component system, NtrC family, sensor kinase
VALNLVVNAAQAYAGKQDQHSAAQGKITIRTGIDDADPSRIWFEVADAGCGIPAEHLSRIFDPFFTTKPVGQGTGLGLSVSYGIVNAHHGQISVTSTVGAGTTFRVTLPVDAAEESPQPGKTEPVVAHASAPDARTQSTLASTGR